MSATLRCDTIQNASSATANLTLDASGNATVGNTLVMGSSFKRNRIINGDMRVDQRNAGASVTPVSSVYCLDRWTAQVAASSKFSVQQNAGSVTPPVGFTNYLGVTSLSSYSVSAGDYFRIDQWIEGLNCSDFSFGNANAKNVTISFWVRSSLTGSFGGVLANDGFNRCYPFSYSISSTNTWTYISITIPGDTTGTWLTNNGIGIRLSLSLGAGSTYSGTASAWAGSTLTQPTGSVSVVGTNGATFYITGVQLEVGSVATPYERQIYSEQLAQCQRYYQIGGLGIGSTFPTTAGNVGNPITLTTSTFGPANVVFNPVMRATPTVRSADSAGTIGNARNYSAGTNIAITTDVRALAITSIGVTGQTTGNIVCFQYDASAEL